MAYQAPYMGPHLSAYMAPHMRAYMARPVRLRVCVASCLFQLHLNGDFVVVLLAALPKQAASLCFVGHRAALRQLPQRWLCCAHASLLQRRLRGTGTSCSSTATATSWYCVLLLSALPQQTLRRQCGASCSSTSTATSWCWCFLQLYPNGGFMVLCGALADLPPLSQQQLRRALGSSTSTATSWCWSCLQLYRNGDFVVLRGASVSSTSTTSTAAVWCFLQLYLNGDFVVLVLLALLPQRRLRGAAWCFLQLYLNYSNFVVLLAALPQRWPRGVGASCSSTPTATSWCCVVSFAALI